MNKIDGFIFYSDGSAKTKYGSYASYGLHGFPFSFSTPKTGTGDSNIVPTMFGYRPPNKVIELKSIQPKDSNLYNDIVTLIPEELKAAKNTRQLDFDPNAKITPLAYIDGYGSVAEEQTNNRGELTGFLQALKFVGENENYKKVLSLTGDLRENNDSPLLLIILSDSKYVLEGSTEHLNGWKENNWIKKDGSEVKNVDLWKAVDEEIKRLTSINVLIVTGWVEGHSGNIGNVRADMLANIGYNTRVGTSEDFSKTIISNCRGYWNPTTEYNKLINLPYCYYNTYNKKYQYDEFSDITETYEFNGVVYSAYSFGYHGKLNKEFGKPSAESSLSILLLKEKVREIEAVKEFQNKNNKGKYIDIAIGKTSSMLSSKVAFSLSLFGEDCLTRGNSTEIIREEHTRETELSEILFPPLLARIGINEITYLFNKLKTYLTQKTVNLPTPLLTITDITESLYYLDETGKKPVNKLRKEINNNLKLLKVKANYRSKDLDKILTVETPLRLGIELLDRNNLNAIAEKHPNVYVITWHEGFSDTALHIKYATIIECEEEYGIWAGNYSNNCLIPLK